MPSDPVLATAALAAVGLTAAFSRAAVRRALLNGLRCVGRYADFWRLPALFTLGYAAFQILAIALIHLRLEQGFPLLAAQPAPGWPALAAAAWLPAAERTAATFTVFTATFPLSAWFALLFLVNAGGLFAEMARAVRKRFGPFRGVLILVAFVVTALAAIAKPAAYLLLPELAGLVPFLVPMAVNALSGAFELLLGSYLLTYLMLMAHAWLRGLHFERAKLRLVAMRRTGFVLEWSCVLLAFAATFVTLPIYVGILVDPGSSFYEQCAWFANGIGRPVVAAIALSHVAVQATLVFHNKSLREALGEGRRHLARHWTVIAPFFIAAGALFFALGIATEFADIRLGAETATALLARVLAAGIEAFLAGWLIASWVCLYKGFSVARKEVPF